VSVHRNVYMEIARLVAKLSDEPSRPTSAVFVSVDGANIIASAANRSLPTSVWQEERFQKPKKYLYIEHAERNAIYDACRRGVSLKGSTVYLPWFPCVECARALALVGVSIMFCVEPDWKEERYNFLDAKAILEEAGVWIHYIREEA
jgi:dCMP deaminase